MKLWFPLPLHYHFQYLLSNLEIIKTVVEYMSLVLFIRVSLTNNSKNPFGGRTKSDFSSHYIGNEKARSKLAFFSKEKEKQKQKTDAERLINLKKKKD